jgi:hypothetical protein
MGANHIATCSWGFTLSHDEVVRVIKAVHQKREREGKDSELVAPEEVNWEYLDDIFSEATPTKFTIDFNIDDEGLSVSIFHREGLGSIDRWGSDSECSTANSNFC